MPPRVNKTVLLVVVGVVLVLVIAGTILMVVTHRSSARLAELRQMAQEQRQQGQKQKELFTLQRILRDDPKDVTARMRLAQLMEETGQMGPAYQEYRNVVRDDALNVMALLRLAYYEGQMGRWPEMKRNARVVVDLQPQNAEARRRMAEACLGNGPDEYNEALEHAQKAVEYEPNNVDGYLMLARVRTARQEPSEVKKVLDDAVKVAPNNQDLWSFIAQNHLRMGEKPEAEAALKAARENARNVVVAEIQLAGFYFQEKDYDQARQHFQAACDNATTASDRYRSFASFGDFWAQRDNATLALAKYNEALVAMPKARDVLLKTAQMFLSLKQYDEARRAIEEVRNQGGRDQLSVMALYLDGQRLYLEGKVDEAIAEYEQALTMQRMNDVRMATSEIQLALAQAQLKNEDLPAAKDALMKAYAEAPGNLRVMISLSRLLLATREFDQVISILDPAAKPYEGYTLLAKAYMGRGGEADLREARVNLLKALKARPDDADVHLDLARLEARQRRFDEAVKAADEAIRVRRNYADAYLAKAAIQELAGRPKLAEEAYQQGVTALPDVSRLRLAYAIFLIRDKRFDEGEKLLLDEYKARPVDGPLHREYDDQIPRFYLAAGRTDKALAWYRQRAEANAKDADSRFAMALILIARNELDEAQKTAEAIQEIEGVASGRALRLQGQVLVLRRQYKEALVKLLEAEKSNPRDADLLYNLGTCYLRTGDARKALVHLERVRALVPGNARVRRLLAEAYYTVGDFQKANELAEALKAAGETGMDLEVIQHDYDTRLGDVAEGEAGWRDFTEKHPERPEGWIGLADALVRRGKIAEGIAALEKAYELDKKSFRTTWSLALLYRQQKEYDKAIGVTKAALAEDANNLSLLGLLAQLYEMAGKPDDAVAAYERIRKLDPGNHIPYLAEAARALSKRPPDLVAAERGFREAYRLRPDDAIIRQRLVEVLLTGGRAADANALVDAAMRQNPTDVSLVVMKARVRLVEGNVDEGIRFYRLAMKTARDLKQEGQYYSLQYDLGQIYLRLGRVNEARAAFEEARDLKPDFVEARLALVQIAVQQQRYSDARAECLRVIEKKPAVTSTRSSASDAYLMALLTLGDIALSENNLPLARQYYERGAAEFPDASMPLRKRADVLLREKKLDEAVAELKKVVEVEKHDPAAVGLVADVLAGNGRADEALAFLKGEADKCPEPAAVYLFMGNVEASRKNWAKAREHYDASLNLRGDFARVYLAKAETYRAEKNVARAIEEARQAIKVDKTYEGSYVFLEQVYRDQNRPGDLRDLYQSWTAALGESVVAANNCAWFLAELQKEPDAALKVIEGYRTRMNDAGHRFPFAAELDDTEGRAWFAKGEYARAAELHERSLNQRRDSVKTWEHLRQDYAKLYERAKDQGDEAAALRYQGEVARAYNKVLELSPASFETQATLGDMRLAEGKVKEAIEAYQAALQIKKDPETKRKLTELLIRDGRLEDAGKLVAELLVEAPKDPGNLLLQGLLLSTSGKSDDAVKLLDSLVKDNPKMHMAHYLLAMEYVNRNDLEKAKTALDKVLELSPNFLGARLVKARLLASQQKFDEAVAECKAVLKGDPMSFEAAFNMGNFQLAQNKIPEAETTFRDLVKKWPDSVITHERLAETLRRGNRLGEALLEYQDARRQNPKALLLLRGQAGVLAAQNRPEQVLREYSAFLEDNPGATDAWIDLAQIHAQAQRWADAERALKSAVGTARSNIGIHGALINFYIDRRMLSEARGAAKRLIDEVGNAEAKGVGRTATARTFEIEGKLDEAVKEYRAAIDADPQQVVAVNNLGWLLLTRRNDADGAIALGEPYLQKAPGFAELFDTVGWAYRVKEDYKKAEPILQHSIAVQVQRQVVNPSIAYHYGEVLFLAGKPQEAKKWLEAALRVSFPEEAKAREILTKIQQSPADNK